eukprot:6162563-Lingulodinium_polyedra.AAC.1
MESAHQGPAGPHQGREAHGALSRCNAGPARRPGGPAAPRASWSAWRTSRRSRPPPSPPGWVYPVLRRAGGGRARGERH